MNHNVIKMNLVLSFLVIASTIAVADGASSNTWAETFDWSMVWNRQVFFTVALGAVSGYVASKILGGEGFGFLGNVVVGIIGGLIGKWIVDIAKIPMLQGFFGTLISSVGGALILIFFIEIVKSLRRSNSGSKTRTTRKK